MDGEKYIIDIFVIDMSISKTWMCLSFNLLNRLLSENCIKDILRINNMIEIVLPLLLSCWEARKCSLSTQL